MAELIRNTHDLPTIRIKLLRKKSRSIISLTSYLGSERLHRVQVSKEALGIRTPLNERAYKDVNFQFPEQEAHELADSLNHASDPDQPKWLQVGRSSGELAIFPWERLLRPAIQGPLLRVPNFLTPPRYLTAPLRMVICVSAPLNSDRDEAVRYCSLLTDIVSDIWPNATIHVFSDHNLFSQLQHLNNATVHDPSEAGSQSRSKIQSKRSYIKSYESRDNEWLDWITGCVGSIDHVHFICPSMFNRNHGGLALEKLSEHNHNVRDSAHSIESAELIPVLNDLGAWSFAMSALNDEGWGRESKDHDDEMRIIGLRLIADRIAWKRPGPIYLDDLGASKFDPSHVHQIYQFLFSPNSIPPPVSPAFMLYTHPGRLERDDEYDNLYENNLSSKFDDDVQQSLTNLASSFREKTKFDAHQQTSPSSSEQPWKQTAERLIDQAIFEKMNKGQSKSRGALRAVQKMQDLLEKKK